MDGSIARAEHISIHAPAKGATWRESHARRSAGISIHAPAKGATFEHNAVVCPRPDFNPRSREGSDPGQSHYKQLRAISIHVPVKGATQLLRRRVTLLQISIHAPVKGATQYTAMVVPGQLFQSTLP